MGDRPNRWRRVPLTLEGLCEAIEDLREAIDTITMHDKMQRAVADALREHDEKSEVRSARTFTRREKIIGLVFGAVALAIPLANLLLRFVQ